MTLIERIIDLAHEVLMEREGCHTRAEAKLMLALHEYGQGYEIVGREGCDCGDRDDCDECSTAEQIIAALTKLAAPPPPLNGDPRDFGPPY